MRWERQRHSIWSTLRWRRTQREQQTQTKSISSHLGGVGFEFSSLLGSHPVGSSSILDANHNTHVRSWDPARTSYHMAYKGSYSFLPYQLCLFTLNFETLRELQEFGSWNKLCLTGLKHNVWIIYMLETESKCKLQFASFTIIFTDRRKITRIWLGPTKVIFPVLCRNWSCFWRVNSRPARLSMLRFR